MKIFFLYNINLPLLGAIAKTRQPLVWKYFRRTFTCQRRKKVFGLFQPFLAFVLPYLFYQPCGLFSTNPSFILHWRHWGNFFSNRSVKHQRAVRKKPALRLFPFFSFFFAFIKISLVLLHFRWHDTSFLLFSPQK
jgi:hypothetical protein